MQVYNGDKYQGFADYMLYGGLPLITSMQTAEQKARYLTTLFQETDLKDLKERHRIDKEIELNKLLNVLSSSIGSLSNPNKIEAPFKTQLHSNISANTIRQYLEYLQDAFLISAANRYDVKGRRYIGTPLKYYFEDVGLRNARLGFRQLEETHLMENVIYNELKARGFCVDVGGVPIKKHSAGEKRERVQLEIDFIATLGTPNYYIQSAYALATEDKIRQEEAPLINAPDSFRKIIVVNDTLNLRRDERGSTTINVYDLLLNEHSLEL